MCGGFAIIFAAFDWSLLSAAQRSVSEKSKRQISKEKQPLLGKLNKMKGKADEKLSIMKWRLTENVRDGTHIIYRKNKFLFTHLYCGLMPFA